MNKLDELIAKFCAKDDNSDRPVHYAICKEESIAPRRNRDRKETVQRILDAIAKAEETAIANGTPLPSKLQVMAGIGKQMHSYPEAIAAYNEALERVGQRGYRERGTGETVSQEILKAQEVGLANGWKMPSRAEICERAGCGPNYISQSQECRDLYEQAEKRCLEAIKNRRPSHIETVKQAIRDAEAIALAHGLRLPSRVEICNQVFVNPHYISQSHECNRLYQQAEERCSASIEMRRQQGNPPVDVITPQAQSTIALTIEVSESVYAELQRYLDVHSDWGCDRVAEAALALFLLQNRTEQGANRELSRIYLNSVFCSTAA